MFLPMIGTTLRHHRVTEKLGEGRMGAVYKARDTHLDRCVTIKALPPERDADPKAKRRFIHEAKTAGQINEADAVFHGTHLTTEEVVGTDRDIRKTVSVRTIRFALLFAHSTGQSTSDCFTALGQTRPTLALVPRW